VARTRGIARLCRAPRRSDLRLAPRNRCQHCWDMFLGQCKSCVWVIKVIVVTVVTSVSAVSAKEISSVPLSVSGVDAKGVIHTVKAGSSPAPWLKDRLKGSRISLPSWIPPEGGTGVYRMMIDLKTGGVRSVTVVTSIGSRKVDSAVRSSMYEWRWRPGTWQQVEVTMNLPKHGEVINLPPGTTLPKHL